MADRLSKAVFDAAVSFNKQIGRKFYRLGLEFSGAGADVFAGDEGVFGQYEDNTEVWIKAKYSF